MELPQIAEKILPEYEENIKYVNEVAMGDRNRRMHNLYTLNYFLKPLLEEEVFEIDFYLELANEDSNLLDYYGRFFEECIPDINTVISYRDSERELPENVFHPVFPQDLFYYFPISLPDSIEFYDYDPEKALVHRNGKFKDNEYNLPFQNSNRRYIGSELFKDVTEILSNEFSEFVYVGTEADHSPEGKEKKLEDDYLDLLSFVRSFPLVFCELSYIHNVCSVQNTPFLTFSLNDRDWTLGYAENLISDIFSRYIIFTGGGHYSPNSFYENNKERFREAIHKIVLNQVEELERRVLNDSQMSFYMKNGYFDSSRFNPISFNLSSSILKVLEEFRDKGLFLPVLKEVFNNLNNENSPSEFTCLSDISDFQNDVFDQSLLRKILIGCSDYVMNKRVVNRLVRDFGNVRLRNRHTFENEDVFYINSNICDNGVSYFHFTKTSGVDDSYGNLNVKWLSEGSISDIGSFSSIF